jgi:hypothetical protein
MTAVVPDEFELEVSSVLRADRLCTSAAHDSAVLASARALCAPRRSNRARFAVPLALAASVAVVAVGVVMRYANPPADDGAVRGNTSVDAAATVPANGAMLDAPPREFQWPAQSGAESYRVILRDASGAPIWRSEPVELNRAPIDAALRDQAARTYYWTVEVEGAAVRELGPFWFELQ